MLLFHDAFFYFLLSCSFKYSSWPKTNACPSFEFAFFVSPCKPYS